MIKGKNFLKVTMALSLSLLIMGMTGCSSKNQELDSTKVTLITQVEPAGEVGYAIVCDFGSNVDASKLSESNFEIETTVDGKMTPRTITKIYTNDKIATSDSSNNGRYLVLELNPNDTNASTISADKSNGFPIRNQLDYTITLKTDVITSDNVKYKASDNKVKNGKVVTPIIDDFKKMTYKDSSGNALDYRLFEPKTESDKKYPLVLFLHGTGDRGSDNTLQLASSQTGVVWANPEQQSKNPCYVLAPQVPVTENFDTQWVKEPNNSVLLSLLKETISKYQIDPDRVYVVGLSNGGTGTWDIVERNPELFAAAVPICGVTNVTPEDASKPIDFSKLLYTPVDNEKVQVLKNIPIWVFQAEDDLIVDVRNAREIVAAIKSAGGISINYTEYPAGTVKPMGHCSWIPASQDKDMINWLFSQSRK